MRQLLACAQVPLLHRLFYGVLVREGLRVSEALALTWSDVDLERGVISLAHNKTDDPRNLGARSRCRFPMSLPSETPVLAGPAGEQIDRFEAARALREHLRLAGVTRVQLFETNDARMAIRAHDLRASFTTVNLALDGPIRGSPTGAATLRRR